MIRRTQVWLQEEFKVFAVIWISSLVLVWLFTRNFRLAFFALLILGCLAIAKQIARKILLVSALTIVPLGMIFSGMDIIIAMIICLFAGLILTLFVHIKSLPNYLSASIYVPAIAISLIVAETL